MDRLFGISFIHNWASLSVLTRKKSNTVNDFLLAGNGIGGVMSAFGYGTSYFSAVVFIGYAGAIGPQFGLAALWIGVLNAIVGSYLAWVHLHRQFLVMK